MTAITQAPPDIKNGTMNIHVGTCGGVGPCCCPLISCQAMPIPTIALGRNPPVGPEVFTECEFAHRGCAAQVSTVGYESHLLVCLYAAECQLATPSEGNSTYVPCSFVGSRLQLVMHLHNLHYDLFFYGPSMRTEFQLFRRHHVSAISLGKEVFWSVLSYHENTDTIRGRVMVVGSVANASYYSFNYELIATDGKMKITVRDDCRSAYLYPDKLLNCHNLSESAASTDNMLVGGHLVIQRFLSTTGFRFTCNIYRN